MASSTSGLSNLMSTYYDKVFLERAQAELRHDFGATVKSQPLNQGKSVIFNRLTPLALATTALSEGTNPAEVAMTATQVTATLAPYGAYTQVGQLFALTSIDENLKEHIAVHGQNAGETIDALIRNALSASSTSQLVSTTTVSTMSAIAVTDVITGLDIRKAVRALKVAKAPRFAGASYRGIIGPAVAMDLFGNSEWLDAHRYTTSDAIERGVIGKLHGVEFVESNQPNVYLSGGLSHSVTDVANVYSTFIFGKGAYGIVSLGNSGSPSIFVKNPGSSDTSNPLDMFSTVGWRMNFAAVVLNSSWVINLRTGATGGNSTF